MAKKNEADLEAKTEDVREDVLDSRDNSEPDLSAASNDELPPADYFVGSEKTIPAERVRPVVTNTTPAGMPADVHQVMVGLAQATNVHEATVYQEIVQVLEKYADGEGLSSEVRAHLEKAKNILTPKARLHLRTKELLEKHV